MNNRNITILTDAINDLKKIDMLINRNRIAIAKEDLEAIAAYTAQVYGGNQEVRDLMDKFQGEFGRCYVALYSQR